MITLFYTSKRHEHHFKNELSFIDQSNKRLLAAVYLLTADKTLWEQCRCHVQEYDIDFENIHIKHLNVKAYAYYQTAKDILKDTRTVSIGDLLDTETVSNHTIKVITSGLAIVRPCPFKKCTNILERSWW